MYRETVLEPIVKFTAMFPVYQEAIKKRSRKLIDYDAKRAKVARLVDRPSEDAAKLPQVPMRVWLCQSRLCVCRGAWCVNLE